MNVKKVLFPTDFSESSESALRYASTLAAESGALLYIVHVSNDSSTYLAGYGGFGYAPDFADLVSRENRAQLQKIEPVVPHVRHKHCHLTGEPEQEILAFAEREDVDLIVIGSHGRTGLSRLLLGSVAEAVVRRAKCPVITVKQPAIHLGDSETDQEQGSAAPHNSRSKSSLH